MEATKNSECRQAGGRVNDQATGLAEKSTKGKHHDKIQRVREEARNHLYLQPSLVPGQGSSVSSRRSSLLA